MRINRQRKSNDVLMRMCRKMLAVLLFIGIPVVLFLFLFSIKKADVVGADRYTNKQVKEMVLQTKLDYNSILLYLKYRFFKTPDIPFVEKIDVDMDGNHKVTIYVYEKIVTGCVDIMGEYLYFDKDGIVVESSSKKIEKVPVIKGLQFNKIILHEKLELLNDNPVVQNDTQEEQKDTSEEQNDIPEVQNDELFHVILGLTKLINKYGLDVDTVSFDNNENVTLKCGDIKIMLGKKSEYSAALSDLNNILLQAEGTELYELDMRDYKKGTGYVIGKTKETTE